MFLNVSYLENSYINNTMPSTLNITTYIIQALILICCCSLYLCMTWPVITGFGGYCCLCVVANLTCEKPACLLHTQLPSSIHICFNVGTTLLTGFQLAGLLILVNISILSCILKLSLYSTSTPDVIPLEGYVLCFL